MVKPNNKKNGTVKKTSLSLNAVVDKSVKVSVKVPEKLAVKPKMKNSLPMILAAILVTATLMSEGIFVMNPMMSSSLGNSTLKGEMTD